MTGYTWGAKFVPDNNHKPKHQKNYRNIALVLLTVGSVAGSTASCSSSDSRSSQSSVSTTTSVQETTVLKRPQKTVTFTNSAGWTYEVALPDLAPPKVTVQKNITRSPPGQARVEYSYDYRSWPVKIDAVSATPGRVPPPVVFSVEVGMEMNNSLFSGWTQELADSAHVLTEVDGYLAKATCDMATDHSSPSALSKVLCFAGERAPLAGSMTSGDYTEKAVDKVIQLFDGERTIVHLSRGECNIYLFFSGNSVEEVRAIPFNEDSVCRVKP